MVSVYLSQTGLMRRFRRSRMPLIGSFGPVDLCSILDGTLVIDASLLEGGTVAVTVVCAIVLSDFVYGLATDPLASFLGGRRSAHGDSLRTARTGGEHGRKCTSRQRTN
jgi:hypothetical protein